MSPYAVDWLPAAEDELLRIWMRAANRTAVNSAQTRADQLLTRNPHGHGRYLSEGLYQIDCPPLAISFTIDDAARKVEVTWVRETP